MAEMDRDYRYEVGLEAVLDRGKDAPWSYIEVMFRTREGAIADIPVITAIQKIAGSQRQTYFAVDSPHRRSIEEYKVSYVSLRESCQEMLRSHSKLHIIIGNYGCKDVLPEVMVIVDYIIKFQF